MFSIIMFLTAILCLFTVVTMHKNEMEETTLI